jgi:hypothetical protein
MLDSINKAFTSLKDLALESSAKAWINREIGTFGAVTKLEINTSTKTIQVELVLRGEPSPIVINAGSYELSQRDGDTCIALRAVTSSRDWVTGALNQYVVGRGFKIPSVVSLVL